MKKTLSAILTLVLAISVISNYQVSYAAPEKEKNSNSGSQHLNDKDNPTNGNSPKYESSTDINVLGSGFEERKEYEIVIKKPGSDKTGTTLETTSDENGNIEFNINNSLDQLDDDDSKNSGGVYKVEIIDPVTGKKVKSKNFKIVDSKEVEVDEYEEIENEEEAVESYEDTNQMDKDDDGKTEDDEVKEDSTVKGSENDQIEQEQSGDEQNDSKNPAMDIKIIASNTETVIDEEKDNESDEILEIDSTELIPEGTPTVEIKEDIPAAAPATPATQNTLPKTGDASSLAISGLGAALVALGLIINRRRIS